MKNIRFIEKYVLCPVCKLPEIRLKIKKEIISAVCRSCGKVSKLDMLHKIVQHIVKNPPKDDGSEFSKEKDKHKKKGGKDEKTAEKKPKAGRSGESGKDSKKDEDTKLPEALTLESPEVVESIKTINDFKEAQKRTPQELIDRITNLCISQGLKDDLRYYVAIHGLYNEKLLYQWNQEVSSKEAIKIMVKNEAKGQYWVLLALAWFLLKTHSATLTDHINTVLKCFYDFEILDEETILGCYGKTGTYETLSLGKSFDKKIVDEFKTKAADFINWLEEAEEEEEGEEEEKKTEVEEEDENTKKQRELVSEHQKLQEQQLKENKDKKVEDKKDEAELKSMNILDIKTEENANLDDL